LSYCGRSSPYLAHQITAPQIAGAKAILLFEDFPLAIFKIKSAQLIMRKADKKCCNVERFEGRKKSESIVVNLISPAPTLAFRASGVITSVRSALTQKSELSSTKIKRVNATAPNNSEELEIRWVFISTHEM
jgi:hypothetical protein